MMPYSLMPGRSFAPWMQWMRARMGWSEMTHDKALAAYWKYTNHDSNTVVGSDNAWCAMIMNAALIESGFKGTHKANAASFVDFGRKSPMVPGCGVVIKHLGGQRIGRYHVTFCDLIMDADWFTGLGGNQSDQIKDSNFKRNEIVYTFLPEPT